MLERFKKTTLIPLKTKGGSAAEQFKAMTRNAEVPILKILPGLSQSCKRLLAGPTASYGLSHDT